MRKDLIMLRLTSNPDNVSRVEPFLEKLVSKYKISPDVYGNILVSLTEAVTNAIKHGNNSDESKSVCVEFRNQSECLEFTVTDEGSGFDYDHLPDPTSPENLLKIGGRGVYLMRQLSDDVRYRDNGRTVEIRFQL